MKKKTKFFETASFHIVKPCNMKCKFCYATFDDMRVVGQMPLAEAKIILDKLKDAGLQKITFAGGEPLLYKHIKEVIGYAKYIGLTTSIITNGSLLTNEMLIGFIGTLDWIGISIDSTNFSTHNQIGRKSKKEVDYRYLLARINQLGFKLKINTVVCSYNKNEDMNTLISEFNPSRWKAFQALRVEGQNDKLFDEIKVSDCEFKAFVERHKTQKSLVPEKNEDMIGGYLLIDPQGRLFEDTKGIHTYSDKLQDNSISHCLRQINLKRNVFIRRGGIYKW